MQHGKARQTGHVRAKGVSTIMGLWAALAALPPVAFGTEQDTLASLSLEELGSIEVTSVSKGAEPLHGAPAAIYVITQSDIRRSGATTIAEALRLAPNLRIMQLGSANHVASTRGFGGHQEAQSFSNKLLVMIDGRSVYSPLFSGVYLDSQDVLMSDIARIEVISGPGATLWGANAMHGVINIITRPAYLTEGTTLAAGAGTEQQHLGARHGGGAGDGGAYRIYGKALRGDALDVEPGTSAGDSWRRAQAGFRMDFTHATGDITAQGDVYKGEHERPGADSEYVTGANLLARWQHRTRRSQLQVQGYFDHVQRHTVLQEGQRVNTFDLELQQELQVGASHSFIWGAGARFHRYHIRPSQNLQFDPASRTLQLWNLFGQGNIALAPQLKATLGLKLEHNSFTGWEPQPELKLAWQASDSLLLWTGAARAIRAPTPFDTDVVEFLDGTRFLEGDPEFEPEEVVAYDVGLRFRASPDLWFSVSGFYNDYDNLRSIEWGEPPTFLPLLWGNELAGETYGVNAWATWQVNDWWRLTPGFELLRKQLHFKAGASGLAGTGQAGNDPRGHASLTSSMDLGRNQMLDLSLRHVGRLPDPALPAYTELSARYAVRMSDSLELSLRGTNLLHRRHREYPASSGLLVRRAVMAEVRWRR
jgi:iron complex outermembrane receptor protein